MVDTVTTKALPSLPRRLPDKGYWRGVFRRLLRDRAAYSSARSFSSCWRWRCSVLWLIVKDPYQTSMFFYASNRLAPTAFRWAPMSSGAISKADSRHPAVAAYGDCPVVFAFFIGGAIGIIAGYAGGKTNTLIMRTVDCFTPFPRCCWRSRSPGALGAGIGNALLADPGVRAAGGAYRRKRHRAGAAYGLYRRRGPPGPRVHHYSRPGAGQCAGADFRLPPA